MVVRTGTALYDVVGDGGSLTIVGSNVLTGGEAVVSILYGGC